MTQSLQLSQTATIFKIAKHLSIWLWLSLFNRLSVSSIQSRLQPLSKTASPRILQCLNQCNYLTGLKNPNLCLTLLNQSYKHMPSILTKDGTSCLEELILTTQLVVKLIATLSCLTWTAELLLCLEVDSWSHITGTLTGLLKDLLLQTCYRLLKLLFKTLFLLLRNMDLFPMDSDSTI